MTEPAVKNFENLYLPDDYLVIRINPVLGLEKRSSWWTYNTHLACEMDRIHATFAKKLLRSGYIEFVQEQAHLNRTVFRKAKTPPNIAYTRRAAGEV